MGEIRKPTGNEDFKDMQLTESVYLQLDSGRLDEWLAAEGKAAEYRGQESQPDRLRIDWESRLQQTDRPWARRLKVHRRRER